MMYKVIGAVIYTIIGKNICPYYLGLIRYKLSKNDNNFEENNFKNFSGLKISEILMNMNVKNKIDADNLHPEDNLLTCKSAISSIVNTLHKIFIPTDVYDMYVSHYYDYRYVELFNEEFNFLPNSVWINLSILPSSLSGKVICMKFLVSNNNNKRRKTSEKNKSIAALARTAGRRVLNTSFVVIISVCFEFYVQ